MPDNSAAEVLVVDDDEVSLLVISSALREAGLRVMAHSDPAQALSATTQQHFDLLICDLQMPAISGMDLLRKTKAADPHLPVIIMTAFGSIPEAVQAMKDGAFDFLTKPVQPEHLRELARRALEFRELALQNTRLRAEVSDLRGTLIAPLGSSQAMKDVLNMARSVAPTDSTVLLTGESGVGKEVLADFIQRHSRRTNAPFVKLNCGALSGSLLESELFGHEKGSFTGATDRRIGAFEQSQTGTIFLDEIGEMSREAQTRLLRVLQERTLQRVGSSKAITLDLRIICATNKNLKAEVAAKRFREDLYYRVNVFPLHLPPLRERKDDIPALSVDLLKVIRIRLGRGPSNISPAAMSALTAFPWPGNVRELENVLERSCILCDRALLELENLPVELGGNNAVSLRQPGDLEERERPVLKRAAETDTILTALEANRWNMSNTAKALGISRSTLYLKLDRYGIKKG